MPDVDVIARTAWGAGSLLLGGILVWYITVNRIGPRVFWGSDVCPDKAGTCGVLPLGVVFSALVSALLIGVGMRLINEIAGEQREVVGDA